MARKSFFRFNLKTALMKASGIDYTIKMAGRMKRRVRQQSMKIGIKSRLLAATSAQEVVDLLKIAADYHRATNDTRRKWQKIGNIKLKQFSA